MPHDERLSVQLLRDLITSKEPDTRTRQRFVDVCSRLARFAGIEANFNGLRGNYSIVTAGRREIPADHVIAEWFEKIPSAAWRWVYGMMATYGIRNHEVFHLDFSKMPVLVVEDDTKTGFHRVYPFYPEWVKEWNLSEVNYPPCTGKNNTDLGKRVSRAFHRYKVPFKPYDLRHAWAVRTISFRLPTTLAARMMGHSVQMHERVYHHWITEDFETQVIERLMQSDRPLPPHPQ